MLLSEYEGFTSKEENYQELDYYTKFLNTLEGFKTRIKNLHWSAKNMNIHTQLDTLLDTVSKYQDALAEDYMGVYGQVSPNILQGTPCSIQCPYELLNHIISATKDFYITINPATGLVGIKGETESFIHDLNVQKYLFNINKGHNIINQS